MDINYAQGDKEEVETVRVPVQRLTSYWMETTLYLTLQNKISEADQQLQRSGLLVRDMVRLTNFQSENQVSPRLEGGDEQQAVQDALKLITQEKEKLVKLEEKLTQDIRVHLQNSFEKLSTEAFVTQSGDLGGLTRAYQSQQVRTKVDQYQGKLQQFVRSIGTQLLYSRSQGILLAKRLSDTEADVQSPTARVLALVEHVTPTPAIIRSLPFYYHTCFRANQTSATTFGSRVLAKWPWPNRPSSVYDRATPEVYLLLGERNSGKTALSWRMAKRYARKNERIFPVYATRAGSARISDFNRALRHATGQQGTNDQIMRALPSDGVLVINDLELLVGAQPGGYGYRGRSDAPDERVQYAFPLYYQLQSHRVSPHQSAKSHRRLLPQRDSVPLLRHRRD